MRHRWICLSLIVLALLGFSADVMKRSAAQLSPRYDEVSYLALARDYAHEGGLLPTIRCHLEGRCREDNRPPLFEFMLAGVVDDSPAAFARLKLVTYGTALLLFATLFVVARRLFSMPVAVGSLVALALMPALSDFSSHVQHDPLYAAVTFAAVFATVFCQERGSAWWFLTGTLVGLAFLTKGSGHLLFIPLVLVSFCRHRFALLRKPGLYVAGCGLVAVSFFLMWRNIKLEGSPFYNVNSRGVWLDRWQDVWALQLDPEWKDVGLGWYLQRHSLVALALKLIRGLGLTIGISVYAAGIGFATPALRVVAGALLLLLAALGLRRRWHAGHTIEVLAVLSTWVLFAAALSLATTGGPGPQTRFAYPYVVLLIPYFVLECCERVWPAMSRAVLARWPQAQPLRLGLGVLLGLLLVRLVVVLPPSLASPLGYYSVEPRWHETSEWLAQALRPGKRFALSYRSVYSTWDVPRPETDTRWSFWCGMNAADLRRYLDGSHIAHLLVDTWDAGFAEYADKLSSAKDDHGALAFLDWTRCFADSNRPSRFLIYCRP